MATMSSYYGDPSSHWAASSHDRAMSEQEFQLRKFPPIDIQGKKTSIAKKCSL